MLEFTVAGQQSRAICLDVTLVLDQPELHGEPIKPAEFLDLFVGSDAGTVPDELRKVCKVRICEHRYVADGFVNDVGFGCVFRP